MELGGDWVVDPVLGRVAGPPGAPELTESEAALLLYFARHPGVVLDRDRLHREVLGIKVASSRAVDNVVYKLRARMGPSGQRHIRTVWGVGYRFDA